MSVLATVVASAVGRFAFRGGYAFDAETAARWFADVRELEAALEALGPCGDVLELAAGTAIWTRHLLRHAERVTAVDAVAEVLELNRARTRGAADYALADVFEWEPPREFDVCFFGFWHSHVPSRRFEAFWQLVGRALKPEGRVLLVDNARRCDSRHLVSSTGEIARRRLSDGREFDIVKRFWEPRELEREVAAVGWRERPHDGERLLHLRLGHEGPLIVADGRAVVCASGDPESVQRPAASDSFGSARALTSFRPLERLGTRLEPPCMPTCASCGREVAGDFAFCPHCGTKLATPPAREQRKVVTVLFCDVAGSTALGESVDPEALRALLARYFERMKAIVERHGGSVEKFIGDAVMAVFGVPVVHEDDALRAVRAAQEMREALPELGVEARIGVNTGEVVTGTEERLATGDAVNVAARLEQAAHPGEALLGAETVRLVGAFVETEPPEPLALKGKAEPVRAWRLVAIRDAPERRHGARFVGRARELAILREAWERVRAERRCELVTLVGEAGVGKSRLVAELLASVHATAVRGRCLPYGEGITYWPVVEVVKQLGVRPADEAAAAAIRSLLGEADAAISSEEIAWAFRKTLEEAAGERPLAVVFDDAQWGEETFLDLVEHVALHSSGAAILLVCIARPELSDRRPTWPVTLRLAPLDEDDLGQLLAERVSEGLRDRIVRAAGGNPLFAEEMVAIAEEAAGEVVVPSTLRALLAARLDRLEAGERSVLERGAVEGEVFHRGSVRALEADGGEVTPRLAALVRRELIRPDRAQLPGEDGFRFRHLLLRDAAYDALPKATRAALHERFAAWLEERGAAVVELDDIVGYHLEQAARYKQELGAPDRALAERAGERLAAGGRRALWRGDERAAASLLERALDLTRPIRLDVALELDLASAIAESDPRRAAEIAVSVAERARQAGDDTGEMLARVVAAAHRARFADDPAYDELEALGRAAVPLLEQAGDHGGLVHVWEVLAMTVANVRWRYEQQAHAAEQAVRHARLAGRPATRVFALDTALVYGPRPADEALRALDAALPEAPAPRPLLNRAWLLAMLCRFDDAWSLAWDARDRVRELTGRDAGESQLAEIATLAGDHEAASQHLGALCRRLQERGERRFLSTYAPRLGRALCALGRHDEAESLAQLGRELGDEDDVATQVLWRQVQALVLARRGDHAEAVSLAREAVALTEETDALTFQGYALSDLGEVLALAGRRDEATVALQQALECYERKKNLAMVAQVRPRLEALRAEATA